MKLPVSWINQYLEKPLAPKDMMEALEQAGIEVEASQPAAELDVKITIGCIKAVNPHPDADRLKLTIIDVKNTEVTIVTGAPNINAESVGKKVAVAAVGAVMPNGTRIKAAKLRGVESAGMLCSEQELGMGNDHGGILFLPDDAPTGEPARSILSDNDVIETTTAANRWDLNGIRWMALEVAAQTGQLSVYDQPQLEGQTDSDESNVKITSSDLSRRFMLARVKVAPGGNAPQWLVTSLSKAGVRSVSPVVDVTNYVMLELGQPLHAYDAAKVQLPLVVRPAHAGESFTALDGIKRQLQPSDLLITDATGPIGLAGVMGGQTTEVDANTSEILLEAAVFDGPMIRKTAQHHKLRTEASARFERGVPISSPAGALARALGLLQDVAGAEPPSQITDLGGGQPPPVTITTRSKRLNRVLGLQLDPGQIAEQLTKLVFSANNRQSESLDVSVPWWRPDVQTEDDLAEEVIKLVGYDQLPATLPTWQPNRISFDHNWPERWQAKAVLRSAGLFEVMTYSFISGAQIEFLGRPLDDHLKLGNPLSSEQDYLRTDLLPSLLATAERNRNYAKAFGMFEFSKVYLPKAPGELPREPLRLGVLRLGQGDCYRQVKAVLDRLGRTFNVPVRVVPAVLNEGVALHGRVGSLQLGDTAIGWIGELDPGLTAKLKLHGGIGYFELDWEPFLAAASPKQYQGRSRFPSAIRDIAVIVPRELAWAEIAAALADYETHFKSDYYGEGLGEGKKSVAFQLIISYPDRTPTDNDAEQVVEAVTNTLREHFNAELRA